MSLDNVLDFIANNLQYSYLLILLFAFAESLVVVGSILSSAILFSICVFLYNNNLLDLYSIVPLAMIGAHAGDVISFVLGKRFGPLVLDHRSRGSLFQKEGMPYSLQKCLSQGHSWRVVALVDKRLSSCLRSRGGGALLL